MSTTAAALNELPRATTKVGTTGNNTTEPKTLAELGKNDKVVVNKVDTSNKSNSEEDLGDEFMSESEFGLEKPKNNSPTAGNITVPQGANNTTTITVSTSNAKPTINTGSKLSDISESDKLEDSKPSDATNNKSSSSINEINNDLDTESSGSSNISDTTTGTEPDSEIESDSEDEKSAAELVAAAAAQIANKTMKKPSGQPAKMANKTIRATGKLLASGKQEQIMKKAMLMMNESGRLNVITDEPTPSIVKLNTPVSKAQIKLRTFRQNFEKQLVEMRRKTPLQIQALKAELANIEFAEIGNKNIMTGLLELVDDQELKLLTIEKMLKHGDITLSF